MPSADHTAFRDASRADHRFLVAPKLHLGTPLTAQLRSISPRQKTCRRSLRWLSQLLPLLLVVAWVNPVRADELTGMPDDPKDLSATMSQPPAGQSSNVGLFLPMPGWAHGGVMPPLPAELKPMGGKTPLPGAPKTTATSVTTGKETAPLAPPKDETTTAGAPKAPAPPAETPAMITVSPFLQWIKSNPQAAAAQARQEAGAYNNNAPVTAATPSGPIAPGSANHPPAVVNGQNEPADPYWLPPLIDSPEITTGGTGGSAAIYSTPQR